MTSDHELAPLAQAAIVDLVESLLEDWDAESAYLKWCVDESPVLVIGAQSPTLIEGIRKKGSDVVLVEPEPVRYGVAAALRQTDKGALEIVSVPLSGYDLLRRFSRILVPRNGLFRAPDRSEMVRILRSVKHHLSPFGHAYLSGFVADDTDDGGDSVSLEQHRISFSSRNFAVEVRDQFQAKQRIRRRTYSAVELLPSTPEGRMPQHFVRTDQVSYVPAEHLLPLLNSGGLKCTAVSMNTGAHWAFDAIPRSAG